MNIVNSLIHRNDPHAAPYTGSGVGIAVLDTGIFTHGDFTKPIRRIAAFRDFVGSCGNGTRLQTLPYDDNGHGTHICGICSGNGYASHKKYCGVAPNSHLIVGKILDSAGNGNIPSILEAIRWVIENRKLYKIRILNISVGTDAKGIVSEDSILVQGVNEAWDAGLVVVAAAGNNGPAPMTVTAPGISRKVITVGAADDHHHIYIHGEKISNYSGRGPTRECIQKPDVVAPGSNIISCCGKTIGRQFSYTSRSGTSMSTPIVSGCIALLLEKYPSMTNKEVKIKLRESCDDLGLPKSQQGWGMINASRLLS